MQFINSFTGGMDKDLLKSLLPKNKYIDARNIRLSTDKGLSTGALENVIGNSLAKQIPDTYQVYKITVGTYGAVTITINGNSGAAITTSASTTGQDIYNNIAAITGFGSSFNAAYASTYVLVWGLTINPTISMSNGNMVSTLYIAAQTNLEPIGYGLLRDNIILFTTNNTSSTGGVGQIWKVTYDKQAVWNSPSTSFTFTLLYNNNINFTKQFPICKDGQTIGRYENTNIQRIYWTDNLNQLRSFNIADSQAFALDPTLLNMFPNADASVPILQKINDTGGTLLVGAYQTAYRLKNNGGATTTFMPLSNIVKILSSKSTDSFRDQQGGSINTVTSKSITWQITGLDTDYDRVEIAVLFYDDINSTVPTINLVYDEPIPTSGIFSYTFTGNETPTPLTLEEFLSTTSTFTKCKTISSKDNRLFVGNVSNTKFDITFDARAYRYDATAQFKIIQNGVTSAYMTAANYSSISSTSDAINPNQTPRDPNAFRFKDDGITIGGSGPNISYQFEAFSNSSTLYGDTINLATPIASSTSPMGLNYRFTNPQAGNYTVNNFSYPGNNFVTPCISPYLESIYHGYQHLEIYRFGIVFFDKQGNPSPVKWIADIQMPAMFDLDGTRPGVGTVVDFSHSTTSGNSQITKILHPIFTVNLSNISTADQAKIGGYSIVRVSRDQANKTIIYNGIITPIEYDGVATNYLPEVSSVAGDSSYGNLGTGEATNIGVGSIINRNLCILTSPDHLLGSYIGFQAGDKILLESRLNTPSANFRATNIAGNDFYAEKVYNCNDVTTTTRSFTIDASTEILRAQQSISLSGNTFDNLTYNSTAVDTYSVGEKGILLHTPTSIDFTTDGFTKANSGKFYCSYQRTLSNQYGGNTYSLRSYNEYISCGHFQPITSSSGFTTYTVSLFGGDMNTTIFDNQRYIKNWTGIKAASPTKVSYFLFFPCLMRVNADWRQGNTVNRTGMPNSGNGVDLGEDYNFNSVYSSIDYPVQKYYPLPAVFNATDEFDNRIYWSEIKINGETSDSWGIYKPNNYWDVEGDKGPINNLDFFLDRMLFWQDRGFGMLEINPRSVVQDTSGVTLQLGTGNVIQRHDYISTEAGCKHQWGMSKSDRDYLFYDIIKKKLWKFNIGEGLNQLSMIKGLDSYFTNNTRGVLYSNDNPVYNNPTYGATGEIIGICATFDYRYNTFYFTFKDYKTESLAGGDTNVFNQFTITYNNNEQFKCFESFHDFYPSMYINDKQVILTRDPNNANTLYMHNIGNYAKYYGTVYTSTVQLLINDNPTKTKVFDNITIESESKDRSNYNIIDKADDTWNIIRCYNDYQNTDYQTLTLNTNITRKERSWNIQLPRNRVLYTSSNSPDIFTDLSVGDKSYGERLRDKWLYVDLKYNNTNNYNLITHNIISNCRISDR